MTSTAHEELFSSYTSRRMRWADRVERMGEKCRQGFVENPEIKRTLGTKNPRHGDVILMA